MGRTRRTTQPGTLLALALYALHGKEPAVEDMRNAGRGAWDMPHGRYRVTKNGDPLPAEGLDAWDGRAMEFDGNDDYLATPYDASMNPGSGESMSVMSVFRTPSFDGSLYIHQQARDPSSSYKGWALYQQSDSANNIQRIGFNAKNASGTASTANTGGNAYDDGNRHMAMGVVDAGAGEIRIGVDGSISSTKAQSGNHDAGVPWEVGREADGSRYYNGTLGTQINHPEWVPSEGFSFLNDLLLGNVAPGTIRRLGELVFGHRETGRKRTVPSYLSPVWSDIEFWHSVKRHVHQIDGEGVTQLPDFSGQNFAVQRNGTDQPTARGPTTRGLPLDHVEVTGGEKLTARGYESDPHNNGGIFIAAVLHNESSSTSTNAQLIMRHRDGSDPDIAMWIDVGNGTLNCRIHNGTTKLAFSISLTTSVIQEQALITLRLDTTVRSAELTWDSASTSTSKKASDGGTGSHSSTDRALYGPTSGGAGNHFVGNEYETLVVQGPQSKTWRDNTLRPALQRIHQI